MRLSLSAKRYRTAIRPVARQKRLAGGLCGGGKGGMLYSTPREAP